MSRLRSKKAMSGIVTVVLLVVLVLVAVAIFWGVLRNLLEEDTGQIEITQKCLNVNVRPTSGSCDALSTDNCNVTITRDAGGDELLLEGVKLIFTDTVTGKSNVTTAKGNIAVLGTKTVPSVGLVDSSSAVLSPTKVEVSAYFLDDSGAENICPGKAPYTF